MLAEAKPQLLDVLINVNRQIAAGLLTKPEGEPDKPASEESESDKSGTSDPTGTSGGGITI